YASDYEYYAKAASKIGNVEAAVTNYKKVLELDSTRTEVHDFIAKAYYENKNWQEAEKAYVTKIASGKTTNQDWYYLGMAQYQQNKNAEADSTFAKLTEKQPTYATGWMMRARANNRLDPDRVNYLAKPFYEKYIELASADPEKYKKQLVEAYNFIGYYASQHEDLPGAIVWYEKSVALDPANEEAVGALKQLKEITGGKK
ncbi:MAG: tetratricopeptide repeat protein, partial [Bacteroidota bacterium]